MEIFQSSESETSSKSNFKIVSSRSLSKKSDLKSEKLIISVKGTPDALALNKKFETQVNSPSLMNLNTLLDNNSDDFGNLKKTAETKRSVPT